MSTIASVLSVISLLSCAFYELDGEKYGLWYYQSHRPMSKRYDSIQSQVGFEDYCSSYGYMNFDIPWKLSRSFNLISLIVGSMNCLYLWLASCMIMTDYAICCTSTCFFVASACQALTFLIFQSKDCKESNDDRCFIGHGAKTCIAAAVFWLLSSLLVPCIPEVDSIESELSDTRTKRSNNNRYPHRGSF